MSRVLKVHEILEPAYRAEVMGHSLKAPRTIMRGFP